MVHGSVTHLFKALQKVRWAADPQRAPIQYMGIDHRGAYVFVAQ